jgi:hypothetical protein
MVNNRSKQLCFVLLLIALVNLSGCFAGGGKHTEENPAGFFYGLFHGWLFPIALLVKFFNFETQVYEMHSTWWYHLGFFLAVGCYALARLLASFFRSETQS